MNHARKSLIMKACERGCALASALSVRVAVRTGSERPVCYQYGFANRFNKHDVSVAELF